MIQSDAGLNFVHACLVSYANGTKKVFPYCIYIAVIRTMHTIYSSTSPFEEYFNCSLLILLLQSVRVNDRIPRPVVHKWQIYKILQLLDAVSPANNRPGHPRSVSG